jgi:ketosteroid isomerase-like protein
MRQIWLIVLLAAVGLPDRERDRAALLEADRAHRAFADDAMYLQPGARLVQGRSAIRRLLDGASEPEPATWTPEYADVSDDGTLGYTYGWTQLGDQRGKYLACWRRRANGPWLISAYARTTLATDTTPRSSAERGAAAAVRGRADSREPKSADSAFAAMSVARGAQAAFVAFAAPEAVLLGPPGVPMTHGRDAIGAAFAGFPADAVLEWAPVSADVAGSGDLGCTVGEATVLARHSYSKYLTVWKRQADGTWKFVADGGNARAAP